MALSDRIEQYYKSGLSSLRPDYRYHFAGRMYLWSGDSDMRQVLDTKAARDYFLGVQSQNRTKSHLNYLLTKKLRPKKLAESLRKRHFEVFPELRSINEALLRMSQAYAIYNTDYSDVFLELFPKDKILALHDRLWKSPQSIAYLSTHAVNFLYLSARLVLKDEDYFDTDRFFELAGLYDLGNRTQLQLFIYLYTHCIIGETLFYHRKIPVTKLGTYRKMLTELEDLITDNFVQISLDNKFEFLVCCRICEYESATSERIYAEAEKSLADDGDYLVDRHNLNPQQDTNPEKSEHRNVLFLMSRKPYKSMSPYEYLSAKV